MSEAVARIAVRLQPRARRDDVVGTRGDALVIRVTAPAIEGRANAALCAFVAKRAGVPKSAVRIVVGAGAREKVVEVRGIGEAELRAALSASA